ncbi:MAG: glycosyltransferase family 9 protein [Hyphomonadaceae bacterium]|nr:glycosyltransferase family 9 protein [Hyphomonadaceae bacterium]
MILRRKTQTDGATAPSPGVRKVLVIKLGALGDFIQALAAARVIREYHVGARITLLTTPVFEAFGRACPYFDVVESDGRERDPQAVAQMVQRLRAAKYDMVYDLQTSGRTSNYYQGMRPWPPPWSGVAPGCSHPHANPERETMHTLDRLADQLFYAGIAPAYAPGEAPLPDLSWVRMAQRDPPRLQAAYFGIKGPYGLIIPGASAHRPEKRWPAERYGALAKRIVERGVTPVVIGAKDETDAAAAIVKAEPKARSVVSRTDLFQLTALAERAAFAVGNDTGPMHIAAAAGAPCVVLFSSESDPARVCPRGRGGVMAMTAHSLGDLDIKPVEQAIGNVGGFMQRGAA